MKMKRMGMAGLVEGDQAKEGAASGHSRDNTVSEEASQSSATLEAEKISCEEEEEEEAPAKPASSRRRLSLFGNSGGGREDSVERSNLQLDYDDDDDDDKPKKPSSRRRLSLFGSSTPDEDTEVAPQKPSSRRRSLFGSSTKPDAPALEIDDDPSERSESTCSSRPPPAARRRSLFGSSNPSLDETIGRSMPPRPNKSGSGQSSVASDSSHSTRKSTDMGAQDKNRGVDRARSMESPLKKKKNKVNRGSGLGGSWSFNNTDGGKMRGRRSEVNGSGEKTRLDDPQQSPSTPRKTPGSFRRLSLGSLIGGGNGSGQDSDIEETPKKPQSSRRASVTGGSGTKNSPSDSSNTDHTRSSRVRRRGSTGGSGPPARATSAPTKGAAAPAIVNPYELVNKARAKKGLPEFSRNMLMDTLAKQVAVDLAASHGAKCTPTSYHGNVGQGEGIEKIHKTMMKQKEGVARANLLAAHFNEIGIGLARGKDGLIYMCQLFQ